VKLGQRSADLFRFDGGVDDRARTSPTTIARMSPLFVRRKKEAPPPSPWPSKSPLEERIEEIMDRVAKAGDNHAERAAALEEYVALARAHEGETWFEVGAWSEDLADSYLALGQVDDAVRTIRNATRWGCSEGAEMLCELAEKLMRSGHQPQARPLWQEARADHPDDVWVYVQAGIEYSDIGDHTEALEWLTTGMELALRTGDRESALEQLHPLRGSCLSALGHESDELQARAGEHT
jgi:tetratricopeptide (TPR) repeat protein